MLHLAVAVSVVLLVSAVCSLFEAVLYSAPISHVESLAQSGRASGRIFRDLRANVDRPIAAILVLNTAANTGGAALAGAIADQVLGSAGVGYFTAAFTLAILTFSEVIPKTAGVVYARALVPAVARPLQLLVFLLAPVITLSRLLTSALSRGREEHRVSDEELMVMVRLGMRSGDIKEHEALVIKNVLSLESRRVRDIMTPRTVVFALPADMTVGEVRTQGKLSTYSRVPVYAKGVDDVVGVVHSRDVLTAVGEDRFETRLEELMRPVHFVLDSTTLDELLRAFLERRQHMVVVIDEFGGLVGVLTLEDVLEEILGKEIVDEFDQVTDLRELAKRRREGAVKRQPLVPPERR
jgi:magnesium and cobalt exporter, CNNM family